MPKIRIGLKDTGKPDLEFIKAVIGVLDGSRCKADMVLANAKKWLPSSSIAVLKACLDKGSGDMLGFLLEEGYWNCADYLLKQVSHVQREKWLEIKPDAKESILGQMYFEQEAESLSNAQYSNKNSLARLAGTIRCLPADLALELIEKVCQTLLNQATTAKEDSRVNYQEEMAQFCASLKEYGDLAFVQFMISADGLESGKREKGEECIYKAIAQCLGQLGRDQEWFLTPGITAFFSQYVDLGRLDQELAAIHQHNLSMLAKVQREVKSGIKQQFIDEINGELRGTASARVNLLADSLLARKASREGVAQIIKSINGDFAAYGDVLSRRLLSEFKRLRYNDKQEAVRSAIRGLQEVCENIIVADGYAVHPGKPGVGDPFSFARYLRDGLLDLSAKLANLSRTESLSGSLVEAVQQQMELLSSGSGAENLNNQKEALKNLEELLWTAARGGSVAECITAMVGESNAENGKANVAGSYAVLASVICNMGSSGKANDLENFLGPAVFVQDGKLFAELMTSLYKDKAKDPNHKNFRQFLQIFASARSGTRYLNYVYKNLGSEEKLGILEQMKNTKGLEYAAARCEDLDRAAEVTQQQTQQIEADDQKRADVTLNS